MEGSCGCLHPQCVVELWVIVSFICMLIVDDCLDDVGAVLLNVKDVHL